MINKQKCMFVILSLILTSTLIAQEILPATKVASKQRMTKDQSLQRLSSGLQQINEFQTIKRQGNSPQKYLNSKTIEDIFLIQENQITVDLIAKSDPQLLQAELRSLNFKTTAIFGKTISGKIELDQLSALATLENLQYARPAYRPVRRIGSVDSQGDTAQYSDSGRFNNSVSGSGIKIGALSDSYNTLFGEAAGIASGDLPGPGNPNGYTAPVTVLAEYSSTGSDEARGMIEIIHDVAPAAQLYARTAFEGEADFAQGIIDLAAAGCKVIVDDIGYFAEPFFQDGIIAQAVDEVVDDGVIYFSAAGNSGDKSYESAGFNDSGYTISGSPIHDFDPGTGVDYTQQITIPNGVSVSISFQWDDPFGSLPNTIGSADTDMDIRLYNSQSFTLLAHSSSSNIITGDPLEIMSYTNNTGATVVADIIIIHYAGPEPNFMKYISWTNSISIDEYDTQSSTIVGHPNAAGAFAIGAVAWYNSAAYGASNSTINDFSSVGGTPIFFDKVGNSISTITRQKPEFVGPDGTNTTFFGTDIGVDTDSYPNFFGTSAAAPHAAGAAVLLVEMGANTRADILDAFISTSEDMDDPNTGGGDVGFDFATGYGLANTAEAITHFVNLPVELIQFDVHKNEKNGAVLTWSTASEFNHKSFILEHRVARGRFEEIVNIPGKGNSSTINQYRHEVAHLSGGNHYFRLLQRDLDGTKTDHGVVNLQIEKSVRPSWTFTTPEGQVIAIQASQNTAVSIRVFDTSGKLVQDIQQQLSAGEQHTTVLSSNHLPKGIYFYEIRRKDVLSQEKEIGKFIL